MRKAIGLLAALSCFLFTSWCYGATQTVELLKNRIFTRGTGAPFTETVSFPGENGKAIIRLINGNATDTSVERVSSSVIKVNGTVIFDSSNFNQNVNYLEKEIDVGSQNTLSVLLKSMPGGIISIAIIQTVERDRPLTHWGYTPITLTMAGYPGLFGFDQDGYAINYDIPSITVAWTTDGRSVTFNSPFHSGSAPDPSFQVSALIPSSGGIPATVDVTEVGHDAYQEWGYLSSSASFGGQYMDGNNWYLVGDLTPLNALNNLTAQGETGRYTGTVDGTKYVNASPHIATAEVSGTFSCDVNFQTKTVSNISITVSDGGQTFTYTNGSTSWTFTDSLLYSHDGVPAIDNSPVATGIVYGTFFGPNAEKIGGIFGLTTSVGNPHIMAIIKGSR